MALTDYISDFAKIGGSIGSLFSSNDYGKDYNRAMDEFKKYMEQSQQEIRGHEAQGRSDLEKYLAEAQGYGAPYREAGETSLQSYLGSLGLGGAQARQAALEAFKTSPGYQFALNQGLLQTQKNAAATGARGSGAEQKALSKYAQNLASQEYGGWQKALEGLTGMGQQASEQAAQRSYGTGTTMANLGANYSQQISSTFKDLASEMMAAQLAKSQAQAQASAEKASGWGSAIGGLAGLAMFI